MVIAGACLVWAACGAIGRAMMRFDFAHQFPEFYDPARAYRPERCPTEWRKLNALSLVFAFFGPVLILVALSQAPKYGFVWRTPRLVREMEVA